MAAERETVDRLIAHFLADRVGAVFQGHIGGVTRSGLFVKLDDTGADGFIPAGTLGDQYFRYDERAHALVGDGSGETFRLGDAVTVRLVEAAPVAGALRFEMLSEGRRDAAARILAKGHRGASARRSRRQKGAEEGTSGRDGGRRRKRGR
jgi:ribonuclease R